MKFMISPLCNPSHGFCSQCAFFHFNITLSLFFSQLFSQILSCFVSLTQFFLSYFIALSFFNPSVDICFYKRKKKPERYLNARKRILPLLPAPSSAQRTVFFVEKSARIGSQLFCEEPDIWAETFVFLNQTCLVVLIQQFTLKDCSYSNPFIYIHTFINNFLYKILYTYIMLYTYIKR